jgi:hypothetical protein
MSSSPTRGAALALALLAGCKARPASPAATPVTVLNGQGVRAQVPPHLRDDPAAYESFVKQVVYRTALLQRAAHERLALTPAERAAVDATLPSREATRDYLRRQGLTYEDYAKEAYEVGLIQKMERRDVFDRVSVAPAELRQAYAADPNGPRGPRSFLTAIALPGGCARTEQAARLANALGAAILPIRGHRLDVERLARAAGLDSSQMWLLDLHFDAQGQPAAVASYDRSRDAGGPAVGPALFAALGAWATHASLLNVFPPACVDGSLWVARLVAQAEARRLRFDEASDELEAPLLADRQKKAFDSYVDSVLAQARATIIPVAKLEGRP